MNTKSLRTLLEALEETAEAHGSAAKLSLDAEYHKFHVMTCIGFKCIIEKVKDDPSKAQFWFDFVQDGKLIERLKYWIDITRKSCRELEFSDSRRHEFEICASWAEAAIVTWHKVQEFGLSDQSLDLTLDKNKDKMEVK